MAEFQPAFHWNSANDSPQDPSQHRARPLAPGWAAEGKRHTCFICSLEGAGMQERVFKQVTWACKGKDEGKAVSYYTVQQIPPEKLYRHVLKDRLYSGHCT